MKRARIASLEAAVHSSGALAAVEKYPRHREPGPIRVEVVEPVPGEAVATALDLLAPPGSGKVEP